MKSERLKIKKIIHAVGYLLLLNSNRMDYLKVIRLLYIADKNALKEWDNPITSDSYICLSHGPSLMKTLSLIKENAEDCYQNMWDICFQKIGNDIEVRNDNSVLSDELSDAEREMLLAVNRKYKSNTPREMLDIFRNSKIFPECQSCTKINFPITIKAILKSVGRSDKEIKEILEEQRIDEDERNYFINNCS